MRYSGYATWSHPDQPLIERDTLQCKHCQVTWVVQPGSGNQRGWCTLCAGPTCGAAQCQSCVPFEKKLEALERRERFYQALFI